MIPKEFFNAMGESKYGDTDKYIYQDPSTMKFYATNAYVMYGYFDFSFPTSLVYDKDLNPVNVATFPVKKIQAFIEQMKMYESYSVEIEDFPKVEVTQALKYVGDGCKKEMLSNFLHLVSADGTREVFICPKEGRG